MSTEKTLGQKFDRMTTLDKVCLIGGTITSAVLGTILAIAASMR